MAMNSSAVRVVDPVLSRIALSYQQPGFVAENLFPRVPVEVAGGQVLQFGTEAFRQYATKRVPGAATKRITFGYQGVSYALVNDAVEVPVPREHMRDAAKEPGVDLAKGAVNLGMRVMLLNHEIDAAAIALDATNYAAALKTTLSDDDKWSADDNTPRTSINAAREAIRGKIGVYPNVMVLGPTPFQALRDNASVVERFKYVSKDSITPEMLAQLFDLEKVVVGAGVKFSDAGVASDIWGNYAVLAYVPKSPIGREEPSYGYTYVMKGHPLVEKPYWDQNSKSWVYGVSYERAPVQSGMAAAYLITTPA